jgi:ABC-type uncharacterized transport system substrate-binding protein
LGADVRRREFISLLGGVAAAWPLGASAQQTGIPVVGFLGSGAPGPLRTQLAAFHQGFKEAGYFEGQNVTIEYRWAEGKYNNLPALAGELLQRHVAVIVTTGGNNTVFAAKSQTATVPIVFVTGEDPVKDGVVASLNRPGANVTGTSFFTNELEGKRLEILHELVPGIAIMGLLVNPGNRTAEAVKKQVQAAAAAIGIKLFVDLATTKAEFDTAFETLFRLQARALLVAADPFFYSRRDQIVALAARYALPGIYPVRDYALRGGLISYGTSITDAYRQAGIYAGRILKGAKPADLPVVLSTKFELVINLKTAKALGLDVPPALLTRADEVIE